MGIAIAKELHDRGAEVTLVMGPSNIELSANGITIKRVTTAAEMLEACEKEFSTMDIAVMSAAVADYTPAETALQKIKKKESSLTIELNKTKDILKNLGERKTEKQVLVGFALETENEKENAKEKLTKKNADLVVLNSLNDPGAGFGHDTNKITIFDKNGGELHFEKKSKNEVAKDIVDSIIRFKYV